MNQRQKRTAMMELLQHRRKGSRRISAITSEHDLFDENVFWNKIIAGFKKFLSPAFPK